jgi:hypothetical protein
MPFKIDLGGLESAMRRAMPAYFVEVLRWMFTIMMIFGSMLCGVILAAPKLRQNVAFIGTLADNLKPFQAFIGVTTAVCSFIRLFWVPMGIVFVEDMLPGLLGTAAGVIVFLDYLKTKKDASAKPTLPEPYGMILGIAAAVIGFVHMFVGWHAPIL